MRAEARMLGIPVEPGASEIGFEKQLLHEACAGYHGSDWTQRKG